MMERMTRFRHLLGYDEVRVHIILKRTLYGLSRVEVEVNSSVCACGQRWPSHQGAEELP